MLVSNPQIVGLPGYWWNNRADRRRNKHHHEVDRGFMTFSSPAGFFLRSGGITLTLTPSQETIKQELIIMGVVRVQRGQGNSPPSPHLSSNFHLYEVTWISCSRWWIQIHFYYFNLLCPRIPRYLNFWGFTDLNSKTFRLLLGKWNVFIQKVSSLVSKFIWSWTESQTSNKWKINFPSQNQDCLKSEFYFI